MEQHSVRFLVDLTVAGWPSIQFLSFYPPTHVVVFYLFSSFDFREVILQRLNFSLSTTYFSLYEIKSSEINLFPAEGGGGRKYTPVWHLSSELSKVCCANEWLFVHCKTLWNRYLHCRLIIVPKAVWKNKNDLSIYSAHRILVKLPYIFPNYLTRHYFSNIIYSWSLTHFTYFRTWIHCNVPYI